MSKESQTSDFSFFFYCFPLHFCSFYTLSLPKSLQLLQADYKTTSWWNSCDYSMYSKRSSNKKVCIQQNSLTEISSGTFLKPIRSFLISKISQMNFRKSDKVSWSIYHDNKKPATLIGLSVLSCIWWFKF